MNELVSVSDLLENIEPATRSLPFPIARSLYQVVRTIEELNEDAEDDLLRLMEGVRAPQLKDELKQLGTQVLRFLCILSLKSYEVFGRKRSKQVDNQLSIWLGGKPITDGEMIVVTRECLSVASRHPSASPLVEALKGFWDEVDRRDNSPSILDRQQAIRNTIAHRGLEAVTDTQIENHWSPLTALIKGLQFFDSFPLVFVRGVEPAEGSFVHLLQSRTGYEWSTRSSRVPMPFALGQGGLFIRQFSPDDSSGGRGEWMPLEPLALAGKPVDLLEKDRGWELMASQDRSLSTWLHFEQYAPPRGDEPPRASFQLVRQRGHGVLEVAVEEKRVRAIRQWLESMAVSPERTRQEPPGQAAHELAKVFETGISFDPASFVRREGIDAQIQEFLEDPQARLCVLAGAHGFGKSFALAGVCRRASEDGHLVLPWRASSLASPPAEVPFSVARKFGYRDLTGLERQVAGGKKLIFVLDGVEDYRVGAFSGQDLLRSLGSSISDGELRGKIVLTAVDSLWEDCATSLQHLCPKLIAVGELTHEEVLAAFDRYGLAHWADQASLLALGREAFVLPLLRELRDEAGLGELEASHRLFELYAGRRIDPHSLETTVLDDFAELVVSGDSPVVPYEQVVARLSSDGLHGAYARLIEKRVLRATHRDGRLFVDMPVNGFLSYWVVNRYLHRGFPTPDEEPDGPQLLRTFLPSTASHARGGEHAMAVLDALILAHSGGKRDKDPLPDILFELACSGRSEGVTLFVDTCNRLDVDQLARLTSIVARVQQEASGAPEAVFTAKVAALEVIRSVGPPLRHLLTSWVSSERDLALARQLAHVHYQWVREDPSSAFDAAGQVAAKAVRVRGVIRRLFAMNPAPFPFLLNLSLRTMALRFDDPLTMSALQSVWRRLLTEGTVARAVLGVAYPVLKMVALDRLGRFGESFLQKQHAEDVIALFQGLSKVPDGSGFDALELKARYLRLFRSPHELERITGRLAGMLLGRWHPEVLVGMLDELAEEVSNNSVTTDLPTALQDVREILVLLGAVPMCSRNHAARLRPLALEWGALYAELDQGLEEEAREGPTDRCFVGYPFAQLGFVDIELGRVGADVDGAGAPVKICLELAELLEGHPNRVGALTLLVHNLAAFGIAAPHRALATLVELARAEGFSLADAAVRRAVVDSCAIIGVEHPRLVERALRHLEEESQGCGILEAWRAEVHQPQTLKRQDRILVDNATGRAIWAIMLGQPELWRVLLHFFDELARAESFDVYLESFAIPELRRLLM